MGIFDRLFGRTKSEPKGFLKHSIPRKPGEPCKLCGVKSIEQYLGVPFMEGDFCYQCSATLEDLKAWLDLFEDKILKKGEADTGGILDRAYQNLLIIAAHDLTVMPKVLLQDPFEKKENLKRNPSEETLKDFKNSIQVLIEKVAKSRSKI
jgi:hypothetical protein